MDILEFEILREQAETQNTDWNKLEKLYSEETIRKAEDSLYSGGLLDKEGITEKGIQALEPYKVKRVVFLAAGFGSRMLPITVNTPKPMVRVHGKRIIETLLDAVIAKGIEEIYIVRGYLGEEFELLKNKYPMIQFIENPEYSYTGTISSFYYARHLLENAYVMESDLVLTNPEVIHRYHYTSDFMGTKVDETDDWYFKTDGDRICEIGIKGRGDNCFRLIGISYWNSEDGRKLARHIQEAYEGKNGKKLPMSHVPFRLYREQYKVSIMPVQERDVTEIDSFPELQAYDEAYRI